MHGEGEMRRDEEDPTGDGPIERATRCQTRLFLGLYFTSHVTFVIVKDIKIHQREPTNTSEMCCQAVSVISLASQQNQLVPSVSVGLVYGMIC